MNQKTRRAPIRTRGKPSDVDRHVGVRIRERRQLLGMSQENLAAAMALTFQQIQKYERGANRVGAGRLYDLAQALGVPVGYFFEGMDGVAREPGPVVDGYSARLGREIAALPSEHRIAARQMLNALKVLAGHAEESAVEPDRAAA